MKRLLFALPLAFMFACGQKTDMATVSGKVSVPDEFQPVEVSVGLYNLRSGENLSDPVAYTSTKDGEFTLQIKPGKYVLAAWAKGLDNVRTRLLVAEKGETAEAKITLKRPVIPEVIKSVKVIGAFCEWRPQKAVAMQKKDKLWMLDDTDILIDKQAYAFLINNQHHPVYSATDTGLELNKERTSFHHVFSGADVKFDPSEFATTGEKGTISINSQWSDFADFMVAMDEFTKYYRETRQKNRGAGVEQAAENYAALNKKLDELDAHFDGKYADLVLATRLSRTTFLHPVIKEFEPAWAGGKTDTSILAKAFTSENFANFRETTDRLLSQINLNSAMLDGGWVSTVANIDEYLAEAPTAAAKAGVPTDYYTQKLLAMEAKTSNPDIGGSILYYIGWSLAYNQKNTQAEALLNKLKTKYPEHSSVKRGSVDRALISLKMTQGEAAPLFAVETISGEKFELAAMKGKFVFIDFWGTWCGPCRREIPHIIEAAKHFSSDRLQIIGLTSYDTLEKVKDYVARHKIPYTNALGPEKVTKSYGITAFPTTFLIDPEGRILAKNLRGADLIQKIEAKMDAWEMKKKMSEKG